MAKESTPRAVFHGHLCVWGFSAPLRPYPVLSRQLRTLRFLGGPAGHGFFPMPGTRLQSGRSPTVGVAAGGRSEDGEGLVGAKKHPPSVLIALG